MYLTLELKKFLPTSSANYKVMVYLEVNKNFVFTKELLRRSDYILKFPRKTVGEFYIDEEVISFSYSGVRDLLNKNKHNITNYLDCKVLVKDYLDSTPKYERSYNVKNSLYTIGLFKEKYNYIKNLTNYIKNMYE